MLDRVISAGSGERVSPKTWLNVSSQCWCSYGS
jgi:hypothetical protein